MCITNFLDSHYDSYFCFSPHHCTQPPATPSNNTVVTGNIVGQSVTSLKQEVAQQAAAFVANGRTSLTMNQASGQVVPTLNTDGSSAGVQPIQTVTIALGGAGTIATASGSEGQTSNAAGTTPNSTAVTTTSVSALPGQTIVQAAGATPGSTIQFAAVPAPQGTVAASAGTTVVANTQAGTTVTAAANTTPAPIQYVLQLPVGAAGGATAAGQPFQIQLLPQHFQASSTDAISSSQPGTLLTDANGNTIPVVQVVSQAGGLTLPIVQDANGTRTQIIQLQRVRAAAFIDRLDVTSYSTFPLTSQSRLSFTRLQVSTSDRMAMDLVATAAQVTTFECPTELREKNLCRLQRCIFIKIINRRLSQSSSPLEINKRAVQVICTPQ
ncbi:unnamed protein product [Echinostoma caproni]|uniref:Transcription initiation factor TFIID subunit 4 n=1 Tax=Echinostoma caproni TaxID=27848 RepID=A0A183AMT0_9TREM|nr:unnamed protein product [Echinostoma caproni]